MYRFHVTSCVEWDTNYLVVTIIQNSKAKQVQYDQIWFIPRLAAEIYLPSQAKPSIHTRFHCFLAWLYFHAHFEHHGIFKFWIQVP